MEGVSAHDLLKTRDCVFPGCTREADRGEFCDVHGRINGIPTWTRERIIDALRADAEDRGAAPTGADWRAAGEGRPTAQTVRNAFGSWEAGIEAAGLDPYLDGARTVSHADERESDDDGDSPTGGDAEVIEEERSLAQVAEALEAACRARDEAEAAFESACAAFLAHPLVRSLDIGYRP